MICDCLQVVGKANMDLSTMRPKGPAYQEASDSVPRCSRLGEDYAEVVVCDCSGKLLSKDEDYRVF